MEDTTRRELKIGELTQDERAARDLLIQAFGIKFIEMLRFFRDRHPDLSFGQACKKMLEELE